MIDTSMMYAVHDAFQRDADRLAALARREPRSARAVWPRLTRFLHIHHTAEDTHLWPILRDRVAGGPGATVLDRMEAEHAGLTVLLGAAAGALAAAEPPPDLAEHADRLAAALTDHCDHEEEQALPLVQEHLTPGEWRAFGDEQRRRLGAGIATFLPWVLDGADAPTRRAVLGTLPPPARVLYRAVLRPSYAAREAVR
ncbi:hemerythrin domain-containing protein [Actinomadura atramentaria]|uniref:hemerythrin domain-containing protein n=1 Tax=Actinomadura atramentaria TaxID=1990 RepID=UPI00036E04B9|nr:hemerythrin domain-containing protein [Actinomadura atramentaria]